MVVNNLLERIKKVDEIRKSGWKNMLIKPVSLVLSFLYAPLLLNYLGDEKYGLWATILSVISWINYFDVGIGNGLRNVLSESISNKEYDNAKKAVSTAYCVLSLAAFIIFVFLLISICFIDVNGFFNTDIRLEGVLYISVFFICINFVLSLSNIVLYALQCAEQVAIKNIFVQILNILGIIILHSVSNGSLVLMALLFGGTQVIVNLANTRQIMRKHSFFQIRIAFFERKLLSSICNVGIKFFIIQLMCLIMFTTDNLLITHFWGPGEVTSFSIADKVYNIIYSFFAAFMLPYWSGTTRAYAKKDMQWIRSSLFDSVKMFLLFVCGYLCVIPIFKLITGIWLGRDLVYQEGLIFVMALYYIVYSVLSIECNFINGTGRIEVQMFLYLFMGICNIPLSVFLGYVCDLRSVGIRLATLLLVLVGDIVLGINLYYLIGKNTTKETGSE